MAKARVNEFVRKFLYCGDMEVLTMLRDSLESGSWRETSRVLKEGHNVDPPEAHPPPLGHDSTTCSPSACCRDLGEYLATDTGCAIMAATRACVGGHSDFVWNAIETFSGHDPYVAMLKQVYARVPCDDLVRCAVMVCRGLVRVNHRSREGSDPGGTDLDYLWVVPKMERRQAFRTEPPRDQEVKGVTVDSWRESERTVRVLLE